MNNEMHYNALFQFLDECPDGFGGVEVLEVKKAPLFHKHGITTAIAYAPLAYCDFKIDFSV